MSTATARSPGGPVAGGGAATEETQVQWTRLLPWSLGDTLGHPPSKKDIHTHGAPGSW